MNIDERFQLALESSKMNVWEWHIQDNKIWETGYFDPLSYSDGNDLFGSFGHFVKNIYCDDVEQVLEAIYRSLQTGADYNIDFRAYINKNNKRTLEWLRVYGKVYFNKDGLPIRMFGTATIITERKNQDALIHQHQIAHAEMDRSIYIEEMASFLAHELAQPLTAINSYASGYLQLTENNLQDEVCSIQVMTHIKENAMRAGKILHRIQGMSRNELLNGEFVDINNLIQSTFKLFLGVYKNHPNCFNLLLQNNLPELSIDQVMIGQVLYNLMRNSIEAISTKSVNHPQIVIQTLLDREQGITILFTDNGAGVHHDHVDKIFEPYFTTKSNGMGLGLSICRRIVEAHGGALVLQKSSASGACFKLNLPHSPYFNHIERAFERV